MILQINIGIGHFLPQRKSPTFNKIISVFLYKSLQFTTKIGKRDIKILRY